MVSAKTRRPFKASSMISLTADVSGLTSIRSHARRCRMIPSVAISSATPVNFEKRRAWIWSILRSRSSSGKWVLSVTIPYAPSQIKISFQVQTFRCFAQHSGCSTTTCTQFSALGVITVKLFTVTTCLCWGVATKQEIISEHCQKSYIFFCLFKSPVSKSLKLWKDRA